jgi:hypothetical protein
MGMSMVYIVYAQHCNSHAPCRTARHSTARHGAAWQSTAQHGPHRGDVRHDQPPPAPALRVAVAEIHMFVKQARVLLVHADGLGQRHGLALGVAAGGAAGWRERSLGRSKTKVGQGQQAGPGGGRERARGARSGQLPGGGRWGTEGKRDSAAAQEGRAERGLHGCHGSPRLGCAHPPESRVEVVDVAQAVAAQREREGAVAQPVVAW